MKCKKCGAELLPDARYCAMCGTAVTANPPAAKQRTKSRGNGLGSVYKVGNSWRAAVTIYTTLGSRGQPVCKRKVKSGFKTKKDAILYLETLKSVKPVKDRRAIDYYNVFSENEMLTLSESKISAYRKARERLDSIMGYPMSQLTIGILQGCVNSESTSFYTARDMRNLLSKLFKMAMAEQAVTVNLSQYIQLPKLEEKEPEPFLPEEVQQIWEAYAEGDTFLGYVLLMIYSGMMPGELLACRKDQINLELCEIRGAGKKTKIRKEVPIVFPFPLRPVVAALMEYSPGEKLVTRNKDSFYKDYYEALERVGVRQLPPYSCRHTTGTEAARIGLSAPVLQKIMRHAKITTTQRYVHLTDVDAHDGINQLKV